MKKETLHEKFIRETEAFLKLFIKENTIGLAEPLDVEAVELSDFELVELADMCEPEK